MAQNLHQTIHDILSAHKNQPMMDLKQLSKVVESLSECARICTACADACLIEDNVMILIRTIRLNLDCADICDATCRVLLRQTDPEIEVVTKQLYSCISACSACGDETEKHNTQYEHCKISSNICRTCVKECENLLQVMPLT